MRKILITLLMFVAVSGAYAENKSDWKGWYENLMKGLKTKIQKKLEPKARISAVAAVRGEKKGGDAHALYWKGGASEKALKKLAEEKEQLTGAVQLVIDGKVSEGRTALEKFIKDNPESVYATEAREALERLPEEAPAESPKGSDAEKAGEASASSVTEAK